jgi:hypothetical protein
MIETLEPRAVPATFGIPWHDPARLTISFAPDGTALAGHQSRLFESLGAWSIASDWQRTILNAFQSWAMHANLNFGLRIDEGLPFGVTGMTQGDPRFGDIRIGAHAMTHEVLAVSVPPDPSLAGTWSGDVLLNSAYSFDGGTHALASVVMHEAGNALGLADSLDPNDVLHRFYGGARAGLSAADITAVQALYGARLPDAHEGPGGNGTIATATALIEPAGYQGETPLVAFGDITTTDDVDVYRFTFPDDGNDDVGDRVLTIRLQTAGISLLAPRLTVLDPRGRVLARLDSGRFTGDTLQVRLPGLEARGTYHVRVEAATTDGFGVGRYGLSVRPDQTSSTADEVINRLLQGPFDALGPDAIDAFFRSGGDLLLNPDDRTNETPDQADAFTLRPIQATASIRHEAVASIAGRDDVDVYAIIAPAGGLRTLTATVWAPDTSGFQPHLVVLDAFGRTVPVEVLANGNGTSTVQVQNTVAGQSYYLRVQTSSHAVQDKGNYLVSTHFGRMELSPRDFATGTLDQSDRSDSSRLHIARTQLFQFVLSTGFESPDAGAVMTIRDEAGREVHRLTTRTGEPISGGGVLLAPGAYTVVIEAENPSGRSFSYQLRGRGHSDPIGPVPTDPTMAPVYSSPINPGFYLYPGITVPYDPSNLPGYVSITEPTTYPPGFVLPPEYSGGPWLIVSEEPTYWMPLDD